MTEFKLCENDRIT